MKSNEVIIQGIDQPDKAYDLRTVEGLKVFIKHHNALYYNGQSEITDEEYDMRFRYLQRLEHRHPEAAAADSPTKTVGAQV